MTEKAMTFPRRDKCPMRKVGVEVIYDQNHWIARPIRIFVGPRKAARA